MKKIKKTTAMLVLLLAGVPVMPLWAQLNLNNLSGYVQYKVAVVTQAARLSDDRQLKLAAYFDEREKQVKEMIKTGTAVSVITSFYATEDHGLQALLTPDEFAAYMVTTPANSALAETITLQKQLNLSEKQVEQLSAAYKNELLSNTLSGNDKRDMEESLLAAIISAGQLSDYIKWKETAYWKKEAAKQWGRCVAFKIDSKADSNRFIADFVDFQLRRSFTRASLSGKKVYARKDSADRSLYPSKPFLMRKLELYEGTPPAKSQFSEIINNRQVLKLSDTQIDSLVNRACNLFAIILDYNKKHQVANYPAVNYEQDGMLHILSKQQLRQFLTIKYKAQADDDALNIWEELKKNNLTDNINQQTALKDIAQYQLNLTVTRKEVRIAKAKDAAYREKIAEATKPDILILLEEKKDVTAANNAAKKAMAW